MNFSGIIVGAAVFFSIGIFHPITIKLEYYFGRKGWWAFFIMGLIFTIILVERVVSLLSITRIIGVNVKPFGNFN